MVSNITGGDKRFLFNVESLICIGYIMLTVQFFSYGSIGKKLYDECFGYTRKYERNYDKSLLTSYQPKKISDHMPPWSR